MPEDQGHPYRTEIWSKFFGLYFYRPRKLFKRENIRSHIRNQGRQTEGIFFLMGKSDPNDRRSKALEIEIEIFHDFIIGDYIDAYKNLTKKTFSGYKYVAENCHGNHDWVLFLDDDTLLDEVQFNQLIIDTENNDQTNRNGPYCLAGLKWPKSRVIRPDDCFISDYQERFQFFMIVRCHSETSWSQRLGVRCHRERKSVHRKKNIPLTSLHIFLILIQRTVEVHAHSCPVNI